MSKNIELGRIILYAGHRVPNGWVECNGQLLEINKNQGLFDLIGTTYGGDGVSNFAVPDFRGRAPLSSGYGGGLPSYILGEKGGEEKVVLNTQQLPYHHHSMKAQDYQLTGKSGFQVSPNAGTTNDPSGAFLAGASENLYVNKSSTNTTMPGVDIGVTIESSTVDAGHQAQQHNNMQPFLALRFIMRAW